MNDITSTQSGNANNIIQNNVDLLSTFKTTQLRAGDCIIVLRERERRSLHFGRRPETSEHLARCHRSPNPIKAVIASSKGP